MTKPFVSAIVPVLNDAKRLKKWLEALAAQTYPKDAYGIIVVDNGSTDGAREAVERFNLKYIREPAQGLHKARNAGIMTAKGEILAFTDADCIPAPDWLERGVSVVLSTPDCGLAAGRIDVFAQNPDKSSMGGEMAFWRSCECVYP
jgi:glycosyltransferase involved in cell wall biosynthesis